MSNRILNIGPSVLVGTLDHNSRYAATLEAAMMELAPSHRSTGTKCAATIKGKGSLVLLNNTLSFFIELTLNNTLSPLANAKQYSLPLVL